jgi:gluconate 5-dehydrogenase
MTHPLFDLTGKVAVVTGATHGLGMAMAKGLASAGATLVINGRSSQEKIDAAVAEYKAAGYKAHGYRFDVTNEDEVIAAVDRIEKEVGPIDILVNNAGIIKRIPLLDMPMEEFEEVIKTDLTGVFTMTRPIARRMVGRHSGKIINICSMMSELGRNSVGAYAAAKGALHAGLYRLIGDRLASLTGQLRVNPLQNALTAGVTRNAEGFQTLEQQGMIPGEIVC